MSARGKVRRGGTPPRDPDVALRAAAGASEQVATLARKVAAQEAEIARLAAERGVILARLDAVERAATGTGKGRG